MAVEFPSAMRDTMKMVCLAIMLVASSVAQPPPSTDKGAVSGIVTNAAGEPLRNATLQLRPLVSGRPSAAVANSATETNTDSQGSFTFDDVEPGRYLLVAERLGYLTTLYGKRGSEVLTVTPSLKITDIVVTMIPQCIIAGRVVDEENEPIPGATVSISFKGDRSGPFQRAGQAGTGTTNADGVFAVGSLEPGRYVVSVVPPPLKMASARRQQETYVTTFYPDASELADAAAVELAAGEQARGVDIRLKKVAVFKLSGKIVNAVTGESGSAEIINLIRQGSGPPGLRRRSTGLSNGEFAFADVLPGTYVLETQMSDGEDRHPFVGRQVISVGNEDFDHVVVEMKPGIELRGRILIEGAPVSSWPQVALTPSEGLNNSDFAKTDEDGHFTLGGLEPTEYRVNISSLPASTFVKAVRFNGQQEADALIDLASAANPSLDIVISDKVSSISGAVTDSGGAPAGPGLPIFALSRKTGVPLRAETDDNGQFSFLRLAPGEYLLAAMGSLFGIGQLGPSEFFEKLGKLVTIGEASSITTNLRLTTMDDVRNAGLR